MGCGLRLIKGSLRPGEVLHRVPVEDDPATLDRGVLTGCGGGGADIRLVECARLTSGLGDPNTELRDFLVISEVLMLLLLFALLAPTGGLVERAEGGPRSQEFLCPFAEASEPLRRLRMAPWGS